MSSALRRREATTLSLTLALSLVSFWAGLRVASIACSAEDPLAYLSEADLASLALEALSAPLALSLDSPCLLAGLLCFCVVWYCYAAIVRRDADVRLDDAHGSARFASVREGQVFADTRVPDNNIVLTRHLGLAIRKGEGVRRSVESLNVLICGGTGTGKTTGYVMPNILQLGAERDLVVVDPKGMTLKTCGHALISAGIDVSVVNTVDLASSDHYNPLAYLKSHQDVISFAVNFISCTNDGRESQDAFWDRGETMLLTALLTLLLDWFGPESMTIESLIALASSIGPDVQGVPGGPTAMIFEQIERGEKWVPAETYERRSDDPFDHTGPRRARGHWVPSLLRRRDGIIPALATRADGSHGIDEDEALWCWKMFTESPERTRQSFQISLNARLAYLKTPEVREMLAGKDGIDEVHLEQLGRVTDDSGQPLRPRVVFVVTSDHDQSLRSVMSVLCWQAVHVLCAEADASRTGSLERPVSLIFDEFKNIGRIANFDAYLNTLRSRNISLQIMVQSLEQLSALYGPHDGKVIADACTTQVYLGGGRNTSSAKTFSESLGQETIRTKSDSTQGSGLSSTFSESVSSTGRSLITADELERLDADTALVRISSLSPIIDEKAFVWEHPAYEEAYMGLHPARSFDYGAWKMAERPFGEAFCAWEEAYFTRVLPALAALDEARRQAKARGVELDPALALAAEGEEASRLRTAVLEAEAALAAAHESAARAAREQTSAAYTPRDPMQSQQTRRAPWSLLSLTGKGCRR